jgi:hypothetical protein
MTTVAMQWRVCPRFPTYEVSEYGDLRLVAARPTRRLNTRFHGFIDADGYLRYSVRDTEGIKRAIAAHVLVAEAFLGPAPSDKHEVAHGNGSRVGCHYSVLRWALQIENHDDRILHGTESRGENNGRAKITEDDVRYIRREYRRVKAERVAGGLVALERRFNLHRSTLIDIAKGISWNHVPLDRDLYN